MAGTPWKERAYNACDLVLTTLSQNLVVLIHCRAGLHRAGTFGGTLLAIMLSLEYDEGMQTVMNLRDRHRKVYTDYHKNIVFEISKKLNLKRWVAEYTQSPKWHSALRDFFLCSDSESESEAPVGSARV
jgi:protein-tyrosine phosphatase